MRQRRWFGGLVLVSLVVVGACGGTSSSSGGGDVPLEELPSELAAVACDIIEDCFAGTFAIYTGGQDCVTVTQRDIEDGEFGLIERAVEAGEVSYDPGAVAGCLQAIGALGCELFTTRLADVCDGVLVGTRAAGDDCTLAAQCEPGLFCKTGDTCPGTCTARLASGQACMEDDDCASGLVCSEGTARCVAPAREGEACDGGTEPPCSPDLGCQGASDTTPGTCRPVADVFAKDTGSSCDFFVGDMCKIGAHCALVAASGDTAQMECVTTAPSRGACRLAFPEHCPVGEYCALPEGSLEGTCMVAPTDGQPCGVQSADQGATVCAAEHVCVNGTCQAMQCLGGVCQGDVTCYSGVCVAGGCAPTRCADAG